MSNENEPTEETPRERKTDLSPMADWLVGAIEEVNVAKRQVAAARPKPPKVDPALQFRAAMARTHHTYGQVAKELNVSDSQVKRMRSSKYRPKTKKAAERLEALRGMYVENHPPTA